MRKDQCSVTIKYKNSRTETVSIRHALGTTENPVSDSFLEEKFTANVDGKRLNAGPAEIVDKIWDIENLENIGDLMQAVSRN